MTKEKFYYKIVRETKKRYGCRIADAEMWYDNATGIFDGWLAYIIGIRNHNVYYFQAWEQLDGSVVVVPDNQERS